MRKAMEQLLYDNGVDIFFSGHIHAYEVGVFGSGSPYRFGSCAVAVALSGAQQRLHPAQLALTSSHNLALLLQRTNRVFNYTLNPCVIAHIMVMERRQHLCFLADLQHQHL